jgi:glycine betaine/proline transport system substrate-binding protein
MFRNKTKFLALLLLIILVLFVAGCGENSEAPQEDAHSSTESSAELQKIVLGDDYYPMVPFYNTIIEYILVNGYDYEVERISGSVEMVFQSLIEGDINVCPGINEIAYDPYVAAEKEGKVTKLGQICLEPMGYYVPTFVIEGDEARGIEPMAPDLKSFEDLPKYWELFQDPEDPSKGVLYGGPAGWRSEHITAVKMESYGLNETFNVMTPGSGAATEAAIEEAMTKGTPWVGYWCGPSFSHAKYDLTLLEDYPYEPDLYTEEAGFRCAYPIGYQVNAVNPDFAQKAPAAAEFLSKMEMEEATQEYIVYFAENPGVTMEEGGMKFLKENEGVWSRWCTEEAAAKVKEALNK